MFIPAISPILLLLLLLLTPTAHSITPRHRRPPTNQPSSPNHLGCYLPPGISPQTTHPSIYNSVGLCLTRCRAASLPVAALRADQCLCASSRPPRVALAAAGQCGRPCPGYPMDTCGGRETFSVYSTGEEPDAEDNDSGYEEDDFPGDGLGQRISDSKLGSAYGAAADAAAQLAKAAQDFISACLGSRGGTRPDEKRPSKQRPAAGHDSLGGWREAGLGRMGQINRHGGAEQMPIKGL